MKIKRNTIVLLTILLVAGFLRFFNLMHDYPYFFNPDERNMATAITQFRLPNKLLQIPSCLIGQIRQNPTDLSKQDITLKNCNLNPHFFAYGQFPLYLAFFSNQFVKPFANNIFSQTTIEQKILTTNFPSAIFWLRFWSATTSTLTVLLVYLITNMLTNKRASLELGDWKLEIGFLAAIFVAFSPGLIQSAHFGTTESLLTFFFLTSFYLSIKFLSLSHLSNLKCLKYLFSLSFVIGLATATKFTGLFFLAPPVAALIIRYIKAVKSRGKNISTITLAYSLTLLCLFLGSFIFSIIFSPFNLIDLRGFLGSVFGYEKEVAMGTYEAFYTRQFVGTIPILFQAEKIFPYALSWPVFILGSIGFLISTFILIKKFIFLILQKFKNYALGIKNKKIHFDMLNYYFLLLNSSFLIYLLPNAFLFAKWTRFMTPVLPFFVIFAGYSVYEFSKLNLTVIDKIFDRKIFMLTSYFLLLTLSLISGLAFMSIYIHEDCRVTASKWIYKNIPGDSYVLSETANVIDIPLEIPNYNQKPINYNLKVISFDFYHLDDNPKLFGELINHLTRADYIFIPSRRIFANYMRLSGRYPLTTRYYELLFSGKLGFEKVAEINSFPKLLGYSFPDEHAEETFTVFDHPVIRIYKKTKPMTEKDYRNFFKI